jgi:hypothetical protein
VFWTVEVNVPACPGFRLVGTPLPEIGTEICGALGGGGVPGGEVVRCSSLKVVDEPATSFAVTGEVSVIYAFCRPPDLEQRAIVQQNSGLTSFQKN